MSLKAIAAGLALTVFALPVFAQEPTHTLRYDDFRFSYESSVATSVNVFNFAGDATDLQQPGGPEAAHTEFLLYSQLPVPAYFDAAGYIRVYELAALNTYPEQPAVVQQLQTLLTDRPNLAAYMVADETNQFALPFLPLQPASQVLRSNAQYIENDTIAGIRYISAYRQDVSPLLASDFWYTFQGLSKDGRYYISAVFQADTALFPAEFPADFDEAAFGAGLTAYLNESIATLNAAQPTDFAPSLTSLDAIVQSFTVVGADTPADPAATTAPLDAVTATPAVVITSTPGTIVNADPTLGGLGNRIWVLQSYGDPAAPTAALANTQVTLIFADTGATGSTGCNEFFAPFQYNGFDLTFGELTQTLIACEQPVADQERAYTDALSKAQSYMFNGNQLTITYEGGVLTFIDAAAIVTPEATAAVTAEPTAEATAAQ